uniref:Uncharacterized protein n=1 Tax=Phytophthora ramorum TaxID=164328 RepID=H3GYC9_PHYRM
MDAVRGRHDDVLKTIECALIASSGDRQDRVELQVNQTVPSLAGPALRPDLQLYNHTKKTVAVVDLAVAFEEQASDDTESSALARIAAHKRAKYAGIKRHLERQGWKVHLSALVYGSLGAVMPANYKVLTEHLGLLKRDAKRLDRQFSVACIQSIRHIWNQHCAQHRARQHQGQASRASIYKALTWLKKQDPEELKLLANDAASTYKYDSALINDSERPGSLCSDDQRVWDAPEGESDATGELVCDRDFPAMHAYERAVKEFKRTKIGKELEGRIVLFEALASKLDEIAVEHGVNLGISWSKHSWSMQPDLSHKGLLKRQIEEAVEKLRPMQPEIDTFVRDFKTRAARLSDSSTRSSVTFADEEEKDALEDHGLETTAEDEDIASTEATPSVGTTDCSYPTPSVSIPQHIVQSARRLPRRQHLPQRHTSRDDTSRNDNAFRNDDTSRDDTSRDDTSRDGRKPTVPLSVADALAKIKKEFPQYVKMTAEELVNFQNLLVNGQRAPSEEELQTFKAEAVTNRKKGKFVNVTKDVFMRMVSLVFSTNLLIEIIADISGVEKVITCAWCVGYMSLSERMRKSGEALFVGIVATTSTDSECSTASQSSLASDASFYSAVGDESGLVGGAVDGWADPLGVRLHTVDPLAPVLALSGPEMGPEEPPRAVPLLGTGDASAAATSGTGPGPAAPIAPRPLTRLEAAAGQETPRPASTTSRRFGDPPADPPSAGDSGRSAGAGGRSAHPSPLGPTIGRMLASQACNMH